MGKAAESPNFNKGRIDMPWESENIRFRNGTFYRLLTCSLCEYLSKVMHGERSDKSLVSGLLALAERFQMRV
ncbi:hypothetical protein TNCV_648951 [Trichonephila clavipes]|uniref:Uncharacterized protein n=1 Tax=Trichonephila clavipes TaxID=2585209 RepID=A0A8X6SJG3_TRICX|nr:hypothetical protein TNCV_648951 [Trichonephila clavipes]